MVKSSGAACPSVTLRLKYTDSTRSTSPESLLTVVLSGNRICTGGRSPPRRGGSTNAALQSSRLGKSLTLFALTTLPVSLSMSAYTRSPKTPRSVTSTSSREQLFGHQNCERCSHHTSDDADFLSCKGECVELTTVTWPSREMLDLPRA